MIHSRTARIGQHCSVRFLGPYPAARSTLSKLQKSQLSAVQSPQSPSGNEEYEDMLMGTIIDRPTNEIRLMHFDRALAKAEQELSEYCSVSGDQETNQECIKV